MAADEVGAGRPTVINRLYVSGPMSGYENFNYDVFHLVSQRLRAEIHRRLPKTFVLEIAKWAATLVLCCTMPPRKSRWLLRMRLEISRGLFTKIKN